MRNENLTIGKHNKVCSLHFKDSDYECESAQGRRLKQGAVPSPTRFEWNEYGRVQADGEEKVDLTTVKEMEQMAYTVVTDHDYCRVPELSAFAAALKKRDDELVGEMDRLEQEALKQRFGVLRFGESDEAIHLYTR